MDFSFSIRCWMSIDPGISAHGKLWKRVKETGRDDKAETDEIQRDGDRETETVRKRWRTE